MEWLQPVVYDHLPTRIPPQMSAQPPTSPLLYAVEGRELIQLAVPPGAASIHSVMDGLPLGVYEACRTYQHDRFLDLEGHLRRMQSSSEGMGLELGFDEQDLRAALQTAVTASPFEESRIRFDLLAEPAPERLGTTSRLLIALSPLVPPAPELLEQGVQVRLERRLQRKDPLYKSASWVVERRPSPEGTPEAFEAILLDEGRLLEGTSSNLFVVRNGVLYTAADGVLLGVTRRLVLQLADELVLPVRQVALHEDELDTVDEAFLTSSSRHIVPIVRIGDQQVGEGKPGPVTKLLAASYEDMVKKKARLAHHPGD